RCPVLQSVESYFRFIHLLCGDPPALEAALHWSWHSAAALTIETIHPACQRGSARSMKRHLKPAVPVELARILTETPELKEAFLVGGGVRDAWLGMTTKDFDVEVFGLNYEQLMEALVRWGRPDLVGRSFGVVKLTVASGATFDFTLPRRDSKVAPGHKGFEITF